MFRTQRIVCLAHREFSQINFEKKCMFLFGLLLVASAEIILYPSLEETTGSFNKTSVCFPSAVFGCTRVAPWVYGIHDIYEGQVVRNSVGEQIASSLAELRQTRNTSSVYDGRVWFGTKFSCRGWTDSGVCGGGHTISPVGDEIAEECGSRYRVLCACMIPHFNASVSPVPTRLPTKLPSKSPSVLPSESPTRLPSFSPSANPSFSPSVSTPTASPTELVLSETVSSIYGSCTRYHTEDVYCVFVLTSDTGFQNAFYGGKGWHTWLPPVTKIWGGSFYPVVELRNERLMYFGADGLHLGSGAPYNTTYLPALPNIPIQSIQSSTVAIVVLLADGSVRSVGRNQAGLWYNGPIELTDFYTQWFDVQVPPMIEIHVGYVTACGISQLQEVWCWGANTFGGRGSGSINEALDGTPPTQPIGLTSDVLKMCNSGYHTCVLLSEGKIMCWGSNQFGECGGSGGVIYAPTEASVLAGLIPGLVGLHCGMGYTCVERAGRQYDCIGTFNEFDVNATSLTPKHTTELDGWTNILTSTYGVICGKNNDSASVCHGGGRTVPILEPAILPPVKKTCVMNAGMVCSVFKDTGSLSCVGGFNQNQENTNAFGELGFEWEYKNITDLHCGRDTLLMQYNDTYYRRIWPEASAREDVIFAVPSAIRNIAFNGDTPYVLGEDGVLYMEVSVPGFTPLDLGLGALTWMGSSEDGVCFVNATHQEHITKIYADGTRFEAEMGVDVKKVFCGLNKKIAWLRNDGSVGSVYSFLTRNIGEASDVALGGSVWCTLSMTGGVVRCGTSSGDLDVDETMPQMERLIPGREYVCGESVYGAAWCFAGQPGSNAPISRFGIEPRRMNHTRYDMF